MSLMNGDTKIIHDTLVRIIRPNMPCRRIFHNFTHILSAYLNHCWGV